MLGPPSSAAGPSQQDVGSLVPASSGFPEAGDISRNQSTSDSPPYAAPTATRKSANYDVNPMQNLPNYSGSHPQSMYYSAQPHGQTTSQSPPYAYYQYPPNPWGGSWVPSVYSYGAAGTHQAFYADSSQVQLSSAISQPPLEPEALSMTPSPPPPPFPTDWDAVIASFLSSAGLTQALRGFKCDMIVMNPEWEQKKIPEALGELMKNLLHLGEGGETSQQTDHVESEERPLAERKLNYVHLANNGEPRSQPSVTKSISQFLAQNRARNDASNRTEFLQSLAEKRRRIDENGISDSSSPTPSCARTDAKTQDRDVQMKYDIAKNEDGPLRRTLQSNATAHGVTLESGSQKHVLRPQPTTDTTAQQCPALDERLQNVESHLAVRYVPSPPRSLMNRLRYLEEHIMRLEKDYPPWAALHFNQPNRGWPPPPRPHPIIVPSHLTSSTSRETYPMSSAKGEHNLPAHAPSIPPSVTTIDSPENALSGPVKGKGKSGRSTKSSLHRAVMEKLEVQKAMHDLVGDGEMRS